MGQYIQLLQGDAPEEEFLQSFLSLRNDLTYYKKLVNAAIGPIDYA
ncbi:hypothetical protein [Maribacter sp. 4U21]|nr:hypothetical protein [Maribacter sp. 4U21]